MEQSYRDRLDWEAGAHDWRQIHLLAMTSIERGKVFARGAYDVETCAPYPARGLLPVDQAKECVRQRLPGGGDDGKAPDGGTTLALQPLPGNASGGLPPSIVISAIAKPWYR